MSDFMYAALILIVVFGALLANYWKFTVTVVCWSKPAKMTESKKIPAPKLSLKEKLLSGIPLLQPIVIYNAVFGRSIVINILSVTSAVLIVTRLINVFLLPINGYVMLFTAYGILIGLTIHLLLYGYVTARIAYLFKLSAFMCVLCFVLPYVTSAVMISKIPYMVRAQIKKDMLGGQDGKDYVKSKLSV